MIKSFNLLRYSFGRFLRDGSFSSQLSAPGSARISCDLERRLVHFALDLSLSDTEEATLDYAIINAFYVPSNTARLVGNRDEDTTILFVCADAPPIFTMDTSDYFGYSSSHRMTGLGPRYPIPNGCNSLMLAFGKQSDADKFMSACCDGLHLQYSKERHVQIRDHSSDDKYIQRLHDFISQIPYELAFEVHKAFSNSVFSAKELLSLRVEILSLQTNHGNDAPEIFRALVVLSGGNGASRPSRRQRRRLLLSGEEPLTSLLAKVIYDFIRGRQQPRPLLTPPPQSGVYLSYHLIITPTRHILEGPFPDRSNSVLRRYGHQECFLRVSFQDENRAKLRRARDPDYLITQLLRTRYRPILLNGCRVAGRKFQFLGYSMSGLKEHSVWFMTPFQDENGGLVDANKIRNQIGAFSKRLSKQPARLAARWSQAFSGTDPSITLLPEEVDYNCPDRRSPIGNLMTDGCSSISVELARDIWTSLQQGKKSLEGLRKIPSAFQFRLGGAKGMVVQDPTIRGKLVRIRPSQKKFDAPENLTFDVQATSAAPKAMFLNRPLIALMEFLGVDSQRIIELQDDDIKKSQSVRSSFTDASKFMQQHGMGGSFRLPSLFSNLSSILQLEIGRNDQRESSHWTSELVLTSMECVETHALRELKYRAHIAVPGSYTLFGVSDEWECLIEGEIYATVVDEKTGAVHQITGQVAITRSPQIHPGDIQIVTAVRRPELEHLTNVVVFSCKGQRALASYLGGGDLDGDDFNLILDPRLLPTKVHEPAEYPTPTIATKETACTISDIVDFITNYVEADLLGLISITHLRYSDLGDPCRRECLQLAEFASKAVDFPKTGTPVNFRSIPMLRRNQAWPDFHSREGADLTSEQFYESPKLLGQLFRRVPVKRWTPQQWNGSRSPSDGHTVEMALYSCVSFRRLNLLGFGDPDEELTEEMSCLLDAYCERLLVIGQTHTITKNKNIHVSEAELVSGTIMADWSDHARRQAAVTAMNLQTGELVRAVRAKLLAKDERARIKKAEETTWRTKTYDYEDLTFLEEFINDHGRRHVVETFKRSWAAWYVAEHTLMHDPGIFGAQSFGLIALSGMLEIMKFARFVMDRMSNPDARCTTPPVSILDDEADKV
ncbi:RdRP-domain-containing protein [Rhizopogon salebrosus TDB-379]|nr:RdRP-domain-containing protein [Rhizopogon salebrosus TDB-379]